MAPPPSNTRTNPGLTHVVPIRPHCGVDDCPADVALAAVQRERGERVETQQEAAIVLSKLVDDVAAMRSEIATLAKTLDWGPKLKYWLLGGIAALETLRQSGLGEFLQAIGGLVAQ